MKKRAMLLIAGTLMINGIINNNKYTNKYEKEIANNQMINFFEHMDKLKKEKEIKQKTYGYMSKKIKLYTEEEKKQRDEYYRTLNYLRCKTGLNISEYEEITFELSFYTDLDIENTPGKPSICANGKPLTRETIANNVLPFDTNVYMEGYGVKVVQDRGSKEYFENVRKCDVFVPRLAYESDDVYFQRVNSMGRQQVKGYILYL